MNIASFNRRHFKLLLLLLHKVPETMKATTVRVGSYEKLDESKLPSNGDGEVFTTVTITGDEDVQLQEEFNQQCNVCCNEMLKKCGWNKVKYSILVALFCLWDLLLGPMVHAFLWNLLRVFEGIVGLIFNPIIFLIDLLGCCNYARFGCKFVWPIITVVRARFVGALLLLQSGCKHQHSITPWQKFHNILSVIMGAITALGGLLLCLYFLSVTLPLSNSHHQDIDESTQKSLLPFRPFLVFTPGQRFLVILFCCWGLTIGWIWGKESTLKWIPRSLGNLWQQIRESSIKSNIYYAYLRCHLKVDNNDNANDLDVDIGRVSKRKIWSYSIEYVLRILGSVIGILWDTMCCLTFIKTGRTTASSNLAADRFPRLDCNFCYDDPSDKNDDENQRRRQLPANYSYETMLKEKVEELRQNGEGDWPVFRKLQTMIYKNYLRDVISGKHSSPILPLRSADPDDNAASAAWHDYAALKYPELHKLLKHGRRGSTLFAISRDYNALLFKAQLEWTCQANQTSNSTSVANSSSLTEANNSAGQLCYPFSSLIPPILTSVPTAVSDPVADKTTIAISLVPTLYPHEEKK